MNLKEYYCVLGVSRWAKDEEIKKSYKHLAKKYHPDKMGGHKEKFDEIQFAFDTIMSERYEQREKLKKIFPFIHIEKNDIKTTAHVPARGQDIHSNVDLSFTEAALGCEKVINIKKLVHCSECTSENRDTCTFCHGTGKRLQDTSIKIKIPRGVFDMQTIILKGKGNIGEIGAENGDVLVNIHILPDALYVRDGLDVYSDINISYTNAVLGVATTANTIYGKVNFKIPCGTKHGTKFVLKGRGIINEQTGEVGNHYIIVKIQIPKNITDKQKEALKALDDAFDLENNSEENTEKNEA